MRRSPRAGDRERDFHSAEVKGLQSRTQLRSWPRASVGAEGHYEPDRLCHAHGRRPRRHRVTASAQCGWHLQALLRGLARHHHLSGVPELGPAGRDSHCRSPPPAVLGGERPSQPRLTLASNAILAHANAKPVILRIADGSRRHGGTRDSEIECRTSHDKSISRNVGAWPPALQSRLDRRAAQRRPP